MVLRLLIFTVFVFSFVNGFNQSKGGWKLFPNKDTVVINRAEGVLTDSVLVRDTVIKIIKVVPGSVSIDASASILEVNSVYSEQSKDNPKIKGFTILLFSGSGANSKLKARNTIIKLDEKYPDCITHLTWRSPNYEVRVGDFRTKLEAEKLLRNIIVDFPTAFVKSGMIELPLLHVEEH